MTFSELINALERLHQLIRLKATGSPQQLAAKFNVSVGTVKNLIQVFKDKNLPIRYSRKNGTYYYEDEIEGHLFDLKKKK
jgi:predicted DNA-binding transcriptional regulator YafY